LVGAEDADNAVMRTQAFLFRKWDWKKADKYFTMLKKLREY
jgi:hypothetical protein